MPRFGELLELAASLGAGPVAGLIIAGLTGPLTWRRGLPAAVLGAVIVMALELTRSGMMVGMPRSAWEAAGRPSLRATPADYARVHRAVADWLLQAARRTLIRALSPLRCYPLRL